MKTQPSSLPSIYGIIGACLTPFDQEGRVDYHALEKEIDFIVEDSDAISIAAAEAAEYTVLSLEERKELMRRATEMVGKRIPVILGASHPAPQEGHRTGRVLCRFRRRHGTGPDAAAALGRSA